jgi:phage terminase large subunit
MIEPKIVKVQTTRVYDRNLRSKAQYIVNVGGAGSSKSHSIAQICVQKLFSIPNRKIAICRKTFPALRLTAYKLVVDLLTDWGVYGRIGHDKTHNVITNPQNNASINFLSLDDPEKIKSTDWNDIWLEEASEFTWEDWIVIQTRLRSPTTPANPNRIYFTLNPSDEQSWINQRLMLTESFASKLEIIHSNYRDNPFLAQDYIDILIALKDQDINAYNVYAEGEWGTLTNLIYKTYELVQEFPATDENSEIIYGLDFGYNNPSALIEINVKDIENCYLRELLYQNHLTNSELIDKVKELIPEEQRHRPMYADCAEPDRIEEFAKAGFNIYPADKEVNIGIDFCKRHKFYTLPSNINLNKERAVYKWRQDKNGNVLEEPVKFMDHLMDAKRYALYTYQKDHPSWNWVGGMPR